GLRNVLRGTVVKATPERIPLSWRGQTLEAVNSPTRSYLPPPMSPIAFFIRPEYVRLIRKDRGTPDPQHHMNLMSGRLVGEADFGTVWTLRLRLDAPGEPARGGAPRATAHGPRELRRARGGCDPRARRAASDGHGVPAAVARRHDGGRERRARPGLPRRRRRPGRGAGRPVARTTQHRDAPRPTRADALGRRGAARGARARPGGRARLAAARRALRRPRRALAGGTPARAGRDPPRRPGDDGPCLPRPGRGPGPCRPRGGPHARPDPAARRDGAR